MYAFSMNNYSNFPLVFLVLVISYCFAAHTEFHQDDYDIEHESLTIENSNKSLIGNLKSCVYKYNDTLRMKPINISAITLHDITDQVFVEFKLYKEVGKKMRLLPFNISIDICEEFKNFGTNDLFGLQGAIKQSNFRGCPFKKGHLYYLNNWVLEQDKFPPHAPIGKYSLKIHISTVNSVLLFDLLWNGELKPRRAAK